MSEYFQHYRRGPSGEGMNRAVVPDPGLLSEAGGSGDVPPCSYPKVEWDRNRTYRAVTCERPESTAPRRGEVNHNSDACIRDIFSHDSENNRLGEHVIVYPGVTYARNLMKIVSGAGQKNGGTKQEIYTFSDKSRRNMMVTMAKLEEPFRFWQDFTLPDDVVHGMDTRERARYSSNCIKMFKQNIGRMSLNVHGIWKREWMPRKSGELRNQYIPHFHVVYTVHGVDRDDYLAMAKRLACLWVKITGTKNEAKALAVALHEKSYRFIDSRKHMQKYMSKYMVKGGTSIFAQSIGRNWGRIGSPKLAEGDLIEVTENEMALFKRCLRKIARRPKGFFGIALNQKYSTFFMFIERATVIRYLEWLRVQYCFDGVPF